MYWTTHEYNQITSSQTFINNIMCEQKVTPVVFRRSRFVAKNYFPVHRIPLTTEKIINLAQYNMKPVCFLNALSYHYRIANVCRDKLTFFRRGYCNRLSCELFIEISGICLWRHLRLEGRYQLRKEERGMKHLFVQIWHCIECGELEGSI